MCLDLTKNRTLIICFFFFFLFFETVELLFVSDQSTGVGKKPLTLIYFFSKPIRVTRKFVYQISLHNYYHELV